MAKTLPLRHPWGQRYNPETDKLDALKSKDIGFLGPIKNLDNSGIVSEYSSDREIQYPSIYENISDADKAAVLMAERLHRSPPQDTDNRAYEAAKRREAEGKSPFFELGKDKYPAWSPEQDWPKPAGMATGGSARGNNKMAKTPAWQRSEGKNPEGGLNEKGRASLRSEGHDIKRPQPEGGSRKDSFCARMKGMKAKLTSSETANDPDSRINKSLRKWKCSDGGALEVARKYRATGGQSTSGLSGGTTDPSQYVGDTSRTGYNLGWTNLSSGAQNSVQWLSDPKNIQSSTADIPKKYDWTNATNLALNLMNQGMSYNAAIAYAANAATEGQSSKANSDGNYYLNFNQPQTGGGGGYGAFQFTGPMNTAFQKYAKANNLSPSDPAAQTSFWVNYTTGNLGSSYDLANPSSVNDYMNYAPDLQSAVAGALAVESPGAFINSRGNISSNSSAAQDAKSTFQKRLGYAEGIQQQLQQIAPNASKGDYGKSFVDYNIPDNLKAVAADPAKLIPSDYTDFINKLYKNDLGTPPDPNGVKYWTDQLRAGTATPQSVEVAFAGSDPAQQYFKNSSFLNDAYQQDFGRAPTSAEQQYWTGQLGTGQVTQDVLAKYLPQSDEGKQYATSQGSSYQPYQITPPPQTQTIPSNTVQGNTIPYMSTVMINGKPVKVLDDASYQNVLADNATPGPFYQDPSTIISRSQLANYQFTKNAQGQYVPYAGTLPTTGTGTSVGSGTITGGTQPGTNLGQQLAGTGAGGNVGVNSGAGASIGVPVGVGSGIGTGVAPSSGAGSTLATANIPGPTATTPIDYYQLGYTGLPSGSGTAGTLGTSTGTPDPGSLYLSPMVVDGSAVPGTGGQGLAPGQMNKGGAVSDALSVARKYKTGGPVWDKPRPKSLGKPDPLTSEQKSSAKAAAKAAGRPYPNLVDNMRAAKKH